MRGGIFLIVLALLIGYLGVSGKYACFGIFWDCITESSGDNVTVDAESVRRPGEPPVSYDPRTRQPLPFLPPIESFV